MGELRPCARHSLRLLATSGGCSTVTDCEDVSVCGSHLLSRVDSIVLIILNASIFEAHVAHIGLASSRKHNKVNLQFSLLSLLVDSQFHLWQNSFCIVSFLQQLNLVHFTVHCKLAAISFELLRQEACCVAVLSWQEFRASADESDFCAKSLESLTKFSSNWA